ncbi:hypothetical protein MKX01_031223 [Papaver californicum]|nr:hypothetical protein MKX01_031223 [Papaver californicum]
MANRSSEPLPNSIISTINPYEKLKIIYDPFHANSTVFHNFCKSMGNQLSAIVLSIEYRLAPENRLPAAYEDATESLIWVENQALDTINEEPWLRNYVDFSKYFIMASKLDLEPLNICGIILYQPHFCGVERTDSELRLVNDDKVPLVVNDLLWELALPIGVNRDHAYCNLFFDENLERKLRFLRKCLVSCSKGDPLIEESGFHGMTHTDPKKDNTKCNRKFLGEQINKLM